MRALGEILNESLPYDNTQAIYAELIDGEFTTDSSARFGQTCFENGGMLDGFELFNDCMALEDLWDGYIDDEPEDAIYEHWREWRLLFCRQAINQRNRELADRTPACARCGWATDGQSPWCVDCECYVDLDPPENCSGDPDSPEAWEMAE